MKIKFLLLSFPLLMALSPTNLRAASTSKDVTEAASMVSPEPAVGSIQEALKELKSLSRHERKERIKEVKKAVKQFKTDKKAGAEPSTSTLLQVIFAILLPPLGVYLHEGVINNKFWLDLILTLLFFIPGVIYALIVVLGS